MREYQLAEREFDQALARGEKDGIMAAVANMAEALKALSMDPWSGFDDGTAAQFAGTAGGGRAAGNGLEQQGW